MMNPSTTETRKYMITVLIPAHNEAEGIAATIHGLKNQTLPPDRIIVVADNCTDDTVAISESLSVEVFETVGNKHKKAGALNQAIRYVEPSAPSLLLIQDADTVLVNTWIETAMQEINQGASAVGAVFTADIDRGWLRGCQAREWFRYAEEVDRTGRTFVLSGTAALIDFNLLKGVMYDENSITEDFRLTVDLLSRGAKLSSPVSCQSVTETMPTVRDLFKQRRRWSLGAIQTVTRAGVKRHTLVYWRQQFMLALSILLMSMFLLLTGWVVAHGLLQFTLLSLALTAAFSLERTVTVWGMGWRHRLVAALLIPELIYALILQGSHLAAIIQFLSGSEGVWHHVQEVN